MMNTVAFYETKPYAREYFERAPEADRLRIQFHEFRLTSETATSVNVAQAVCVFVTTGSTLVFAATSPVGRPARGLALRGFQQC